MKRIVCLLCLLGLLLTGCGGGNVSQVQTVVGESEIFTQREIEDAMEVAMNYFRKEFAVVRNDLGSAGRAANEIKQILKDRKVDRTVARRVAIAAYELEINVCIHSHGGILTFILDDNTITIKTKDRGPGIPDIEWACRDGASTANDWIRSMGFGAGMGLPNSKRVSDKFEIESEVGKYTKVTCTFNLGEVKEQGK